MTRRRHITTAIHYSNGPPHLGHAYEDIAADAYARSLRQRFPDAEVTFVTGTDEHGQKNRDAAAKAGLDPKAFVDQNSAIFRRAFDDLGISYTNFVRTTDAAHKEFVQRMLARTYQHGDISFREYAGLYCVGCERFYTDKELLPGNICPEHNQPVEPLTESNYFLNLEKYRERIRAHIESHPDFIRPDRYRNEALNMLSEPLADLCISRPKTRLNWGIELPFDSQFVTYVWYDAFWAYLSELPDTSDAALRSILPETDHFIGKDILKTHAVYWPAMLMAVDLPLYAHLNVHGYLTSGGSRMSKSSGNIVDPLELANRIGPEVLRYFVLREFVYGLDGDFTEERLVARYNSDLANDLGNLTSRVLAMVERYCGGVLAAGPIQSAAAGSDDEAFLQIFSGVAGQTKADAFSTKVADLVSGLNFKAALEIIWNLLDAANKYVVKTSPFTLAKDPAQAPRVAQILANLCEAIRVIAGALAPFMPKTSAAILDLLNVDQAVAHKPFGYGLERGHRVKPPVALFPRIEKKRA